MSLEIFLTLFKIPDDISVFLLINVWLSMKVPTTLVRALTAAFFAASSILVPIPLEITVFISNPCEEGLRIFLFLLLPFYLCLYLKTFL